MKLNITKEWLEKHREADGQLPEPAAGTGEDYIIWHESIVCPYCSKDYGEASCAELVSHRGNVFECTACRGMMHVSVEGGYDYFTTKAHWMQSKSIDDMIPEQVDDHSIPPRTPCDWEDHDKAGKPFPEPVADKPVEFRIFGMPVVIGEDLPPGHFVIGKRLFKMDANGPVEVETCSPQVYAKYLEAKGKR